MQKVRHREQRDKLRNGDRHNKNRAKHRLTHHPFAVDKHGKEYSRKITAYRGNERPTEQRKERARNLRIGKYLAERFKTDPIEQRRGRQMVVVVARKRHENHVHERDHGKRQHA